MPSTAANAGAPAMRQRWSSTPAWWDRPVPSASFCIDPKPTTLLHLCLSLILCVSSLYVKVLSAAPSFILSALPSTQTEQCSNHPQIHLRRLTSGLSQTHYMMLFFSQILLNILLGPVHWLLPSHQWIIALLNDVKELVETQWLKWPEMNWTQPFFKSFWMYLEEDGFLQWSHPP